MVYLVAKLINKPDYSSGLDDLLHVFPMNLFSEVNLSQHSSFDKVLFSTKKYLYFSYFSTKTYVMVLIRSASARHF